MNDKIRKAFESSPICADAYLAMTNGHYVSATVNGMWRDWQASQSEVDGTLTSDGTNAQQVAVPEQQPLGWMIEGSSIVAKGDFAELDTKAEAKRIGGTCKAYPIYREPVMVEQEPVATVQCINGITIGYLDVMQPVGTKLYAAPVDIEALTKERDEYKQRMQRLIRSQFEITKERDALMAQLEKIEAKFETACNLALRVDAKNVNLKAAAKLAMFHMERNQYLVRSGAPSISAAISALKKAGVAQ